eukprot:s107_g51.t1
MATAMQRLKVPTAHLRPPWFTPPEAAFQLPEFIDSAAVGGAPSRFYHYADAAEASNNVSPETRKFLQACRTDVDEVRVLLDDGAAVYQANANGFSGLHMAAANLQTDVAQLLLERGHDVNVMEANGLTPLDYCVDAGFSAAEISGLNYSFALRLLLSSAQLKFLSAHYILSVDAERDASENGPKDMSEADIDKVKEGGRDLARDFQSHLNGLSAVFNQLLGQHDLEDYLSPSSHFDKGTGLAAPFQSAPAEKQRESKSKKSPKELLALRETTRQPTSEGPELSVLTEESQQELKNQYERLDIENNGKLSCNDLEHVVKEFGNGWEVEDMFSLVCAALEVQLRRATSSKKQSLKKGGRKQTLTNGGLSELGLGGSNYVIVDFETFKVLAVEDPTETDTFTLAQQSDAKILRGALHAEQTWSRYQNDGHLRGQTTFEMKPEISSLQRKAHAFFDIVVNVIFVGFSVDMQKDDPNNPVWQVVEIIFPTFYFFEAVGKLAVFGCRWYFLGEEYLWKLGRSQMRNWFDFTCLLLSLGDLVLFIYVEISKVENPLDLQTLMLATLIYTAAIAATSMFGGDERVPEMRSLSRSWLLAPNTDTMKNLVALARFTLFRCFTDGCAAYDGTPLSERLYDIYGGWWVVPYVFLFVGVTLGLFNLIMAIFIDNVMASQMQRKLQEISNTAKSDVEQEIVHLDDHYHSNMARVRAKFDLLVSAEIVDREFIAVLKDADIETANESGIYEVLDADMSNTLSIEEVYVGLMRLRGPIAKSEIVGLILRLRHLTTLIAEMSRKQE